MLGAGRVIFASVGSMMPFDRFAQAVDEWAAENPQVPVFLQLGKGAYEPRHVEWKRMIPHVEYVARLRDSRLFVAHAGMGSILQGLEMGKQMLLLPRQAALREHTTDHQLHTAMKFRGTPGLMIVDDESGLRTEMTRLVESPLPEAGRLAPFATPQFTDRIREYLRAGAPVDQRWNPRSMRDNG